MVGSQYADVETKLYSGETLSEFIGDYYGFRYDFMWVVSVVLIGFALFFALGYTFCMKALNFQRR